MEDNGFVSGVIALYILFVVIVGLFRFMVYIIEYDENAGDYDLGTFGRMNSYAINYLIEPFVTDRYTTFGRIIFIVLTPVYRAEVFAVMVLANCIALGLLNFRSLIFRDTNEE